MKCCASHDILHHGNSLKFLKSEHFRVKLYGSGKE